MTTKPREGEIRVVNYIIGTTPINPTDPDSPEIINYRHRIDQCFDGVWREVRVYHEAEDGTLTPVKQGSHPVEEQ